MHPFVYLDTCVLIGFSQGKHQALLDKFKSDLTAVYSDATINDLQVSGDDNPQLKLLDQIGAWHICSNDKDGAQCLPSQTSATEREKVLRGNDAQNIRNAETGINQLKADLHRPSALTVKGVLQRVRNAFMPLLKNADKMCQSYGIQSSFAEEMAKIDISENAAYTVEKFQKEAKQVTRGGSDAIANFRPPKIIEQIRDRMSDTDKEEFRAALAHDPVTITGLTNCAEMISSLGYGRDKKLVNQSNAVAMRGARSELHDHQHIAFGFTCLAIATSDKGLAIKAYALAEYYGLPSRVIYAPNSGSCPYILTEERWVE